MTQQIEQTVRRHADGSIDYAFYDRHARYLRSTDFCTALENLSIKRIGAVSSFVIGTASFCALLAFAFFP